MLYIYNMNITSSTAKIGALIKKTREEKGMTQGELAKALKTSQSAVARMESGKQNFTTSQLVKIGEVLERRIVELSRGGNDFEIQGGHKLSGTITTKTSKNGALGLLCASLLNKGKTTLHNIPNIEEIHRIIEIYESIGVDVEWLSENSLRIQPPKKFKLDNLDKEAAGKIRSALMMIGALIHTEKDFQLPHAGGCKMGERTIVAHKHGLESFGVSIKTEQHAYHITNKKLKPATVVLYEASDTATENILIAASGIAGTSVIEFAQQNYMVLDVCYYLTKLGVKIDGIHTHTLTITGKKNINADVEHYNSEDPIESMMLISAAIVTKSELTITRCSIDFLKRELLVLENMGLRYKQTKPYLSHNKKTRLVDITIFPSKLHAISDKIHATPYPGINTDNLPFFVPIATQAKGTTLIHDWMWENRAIYFTELNRLGAHISLADPHRVFIEGPTKLQSTQIVCPPALRPSTMIFVAMLGAEGTSTLRNVYAIKRGYENIVERLNAIGARIKHLDDL